MSCCVFVGAGNGSCDETGEGAGNETFGSDRFRIFRRLKQATDPVVAFSLVQAKDLVMELARVLAAKLGDIIFVGAGDRF
jgi:2-keto-3-deoxy-L-rhamnonate aldolase RhmA